MGCDAQKNGLPSNPRWFQSTHPHGVRRGRSRTRWTASSFNPRTHMGCDLTIRHPGIRVSRFNPRTHMGCDENKINDKNEEECFNPRTHMGCDLLGYADDVKVVEFQSTHPHGVRPDMGYDTLLKQMFQSTHPHGVRPRVTVSTGTITSFNPRTHMGCDGGRAAFIVRYHVSIHAPTWGATSATINALMECDVSIHAPTWGATLHHCTVQIAAMSFNPRTHVGCDSYSANI